MDKLTDIMFDIGYIPVLCPVEKTETEIGRNLFRYLFKKTANRTQQERVDGFYCRACDRVHPILENIRPYFGC